MADANGNPTLEEIRAERERRARAARTQAGAGGQPVTVEAIRAERERRRQPQPQRVGQGEDVARSFGTGLERAPGLVLGMFRDLGDAADNVAVWGARQARRAQGREFSEADERQTRLALRGIGAVRDAATTTMFGPAGQTVTALRHGPSSQEITDVVGSFIPGEPHEPQTTAGEYARTIGEFAPAALIPGGALTRGARVLVPAAASETGGQIGRQFGPEAEIAGRIIGGVGGGVLTEASVAANAGRIRRAGQPAPGAEELETEFGPLTRGERSGRPRARLEEDDLRRGIGSEQAQSVMRTFDARRAPVIRENAMRVVTRGQPALSENVGEAGVILGDELRSARQAIWARAQQQYDEAFNLAKSEPVPPSDELTARIADTARENMFEVPADAGRTLAALQNEIRQGRATQANVERARQELTRRRTQAVNNRQDADEFVYSTLIETLDDWSSGLVRNPQAQRAMQEARGIYREMRSLYGQRGRTELSTGQTGRMDPGGRAVDRAINTDLTGEQIIDGILGTGTRPSAQTLGAVRRIKQLGTERIIYTNRSAESGVRVPGRSRVGGRTAGQRRFEADDPNAPPSQQNPRGGMEQPTAELQALREGLWHRLLRPLDDYVTRIEQAGAREGGLLPAQRMVSQLDNALNKSGAEIMRVLYTPRELQAMQRLLRYFQKIVPPPGANYSGTAAALYRSISGALQAAVNVIPGIGWALSALRGMARDFSSTIAAERATAPVRPRAPLRPGVEPDEPNRAAPVASAVLALPPPEEDLRP